MEMEVRFRNNDLGPLFPTFQERVNAMLPAAASEAEVASSAAPVLNEPSLGSPHMLNDLEVQQTLAQVEEEAALQNQELAQVHSGLNEQRVARLLGLLD